MIACSAPRLHTVRWQTAELAHGGDQVRLVYSLDVCEELHHVEIDYAAELTLTIYATDNDRACLGIRFVRSVNVPLRDRFDDATFRDGA
jgi:hypothetical protein